MIIELFVKYHRSISIFLIIVGIIFTSIGGILDITKTEEITLGNIHISKKHFWTDGTYVTVLAIALLLLNK
jgi:hypothetical protein